MADIRREARRPPAFARRDLIALSGVPRHVERSEGGVGGALATSDCARTDSRAIDQMPEVLVDPNAFFDGLAPLCDPVCGDIDDLTIITRSWQSIDLATALSGAAG